MFKKILASEKGFGLVHVLAALIIVTVSVAGLFIASVVARSKAVENYHYRSALLVASAKMELIRYHNRNLGNNYVNVNNIINLYDEVVIDEHNNNKVIVSIPSPYPLVDTYTDIQVSPNVMYDRVRLRVKWTEPQMLFMPMKTKYITLYEDYFRRANL
ncbi:MAG: hypothetical protein APR54_00890 [Candidatus Cloacimonas sp. SDB]|jgi:competence protein ComGC|nr:MAG: hypothetical protein APR54_00890 [Candidatus Cloacimonas sp. SDB]